MKLEVHKYYYLTNRGFASEIVQLINAISHSLIYGSKLFVVSKSWNVKYKDGWSDYFVPTSALFILSDNTKPKYKISDLRISIPLIKYLYIITIFKRNGAISPSKGLLKYLKNMVKIMLYAITNQTKQYHCHEIVGGIGTNLNPDAKMLWQNNINWGNKEKTINFTWNNKKYNLLSELHCDIATALFSEIRKQISDLYLAFKKENIKSSSYISLHIRRGDKLIQEAQFISTLDYAKAIERFATNQNTVFVSTDDFSVIQELRDYNNNWNIIALTPDDFDGHQQGHFNKQEKERIRANTELLLAELLLHKNAEVFIGTITSNISRLIAYSRNKKSTTYSLDRIDTNTNIYNELITYI